MVWFDHRMVRIIVLVVIAWCVISVPMSVVAGALLGGSRPAAGNTDDMTLGHEHVADTPRAGRVSTMTTLSTAVTRATTAPRVTASR